jgi:eukaryotic-like serine/threonine-protein kinase
MNEKSIFAAALEIDSPAQRQAFLNDACAGNDTLRAQVEDLLQASAQAGSFLDVPLAGFDVATALESWINMKSSR